MKYKLEFGQPVGGGTTVPLDLSSAADADKVKSVRVTAAPNTALFDGGVRYLQNNVMVEHNPHPYTAAMAQLLTKPDIPGTDTGSAGMLSLRKDVNKSVSFGNTVDGAGSASLSARGSNTALLPIDAGSQAGGYGPTEYFVPAKTLGNNSTLRGLMRDVVMSGQNVGNSDVTLGHAGTADLQVQILDTGVIQTNDGVLKIAVKQGDDTATGYLSPSTAGSILSKFRFGTLVLFSGVTGAKADRVNDKKGRVLSDTVAAKRSVSGVDVDVYEFDVAIEGGEEATTVVDAADAADYDFSALVLSHEVYPLEADLQDLPLSILGDALSSMGFSGDNKADNVNPKQEIVTAGAGSFEYSQPLFLASMSHGYAVGPSDHQLFLTISNFWEKDLLHCPKVGDAARAYTSTVAATSSSAPTDTLAAGRVRIHIEEVELHVAYVTPSQMFVPPSQSLRFSELQVDTRVVTSTQVQESLVVKPGTRQVLFGMRQDDHGIHMDREELGLAMAGINEAGIPGASMSTFSDFQLQIGGIVAPTVAFSQMDPSKAHMARPYQEFLNVIGKPGAMRGNTLTFAEYIGSHNSNSPSGPGKGDHGPVFALRLLTPANELNNELQVRGKLTGHDPAALQQMVIISVADRLLDIQYAPPQEIPVSTAVNDLL